MHAPVRTDVFCYRFANRSNPRSFDKRRSETLAEIDIAMDDVDGYARLDTNADGVIEFDVPEIALFYFGSVIIHACEAHGVETVGITVS